jgi:hypothetical protein
MSRIKDNQRVGKIGEFIHRVKRLGEGRDLKRTGIGSDYSYEKDYLIGTKLRKSYDEVKTGNAKLSPRQKQMRKKVPRYNVEKYHL